MKNLLKIMMACILMAFVFIQCGGESGSESDTCEPATIDVNGTWTIATTSGPNTCGDPIGDIEVETIILIQNGNSLTETTSGLTGRVCGNSISLNGTLPDGSGTLNINLQGSGTSNSASGNVTWVYSETGYSCTGTDTFTAFKTIADGNDTFATATPITLPYTSSEASISTVIDVDYYVFTTSSASTIEVTMTGLTDDLDVYFFDDSQNPLGGSANGETDDEFFAYDSPTAGTFYIMVEGFGAAVSSYTLSVSEI